MQDARICPLGTALSLVTHRGGPAGTFVSRGRAKVRRWKVGIVGAILMVGLQALTLAAPEQRIMLTVAGGGWPNDVPAVTAPVGDTRGVAVDSAGNLFITSPTVNRVFKVAADGKLTVVAGNGGTGFSGDGGPATSASLSSPAAVAVDIAGNIKMSVTAAPRNW